MDTKLAGYAGSNPPGTVAADFMELLLFGTFTPELETFLCKDMTDKGLKRWNTFIFVCIRLLSLKPQFCHPLNYRIKLYITKS